MTFSPCMMTSFQHGSEQRATEAERRAEEQIHEHVTIIIYFS